jgi:parallel beta-helix repeat protein
MSIGLIGFSISFVSCTHPSAPASIPDPASTPTPSPSPIQRMIDAEPEGTTFHLAARTYRISTPIVPKAGDRLIGAGEGVTVLDGGGSGSNGIDTKGGIAGVLVADLTVTGFNDGIRLGPAWQVTSVEATGNVTGLQFAGFAGATITDVSAHDNGRFGIHGSSDQGQVISSDVFRNHTDASWPSGFSGGLKLVNCTGVAVRNTSIHDNFGVGLWFDEEVHDAIATGNEVNNNDDDGIRVEISAGIELLNNTVNGSVVVFNSSSTLVQGNVISAPSSIASPLRFMGNGRLQDGVEFMNAHNQAVGNAVTLAPGQFVGVIRTSGTTIDNTFRDNVYRVASLTAPSFEWWDGSEMLEVDWMTWTGVYGQDLHGNASTTLWS